MGTQLARSELGKEHNSTPAYKPNGHLHLTIYNLTDQIYTPTGIASAERKVGDRERTRNELARYIVYAFEIRNVSTHNNVASFFFGVNDIV